MVKHGKKCKNLKPCQNRAKHGKTGRNMTKQGAIWKQAKKYKNCKTMRNMVKHAKTWQNPVKYGRKW